MFKIILYSVCCIFLPLVIQVDSLYEGDDCYDEGQPGICTILEKCHHLMQIIKNAGMTSYMREKLYHLSCGFHSTKQIVCCISSDDTRPIYNPANTHDWDSTHHYSNNNPDINIWNSFVETNSNSGAFNKTSSDSNFIENSGDNGVDVNGRVSDVLLDIQNHPNFKLLPEICGNIDSNRILGGKNAALFEMPWLVLLSYYTGRRTKENCGGTLITEYYVLTAAHCVSFLKTGTRLNGVILGEHDLNHDPDCRISFNKTYCAPNIINATIAQVIPHPGFSLKTMFDDIALIRLSEPVDFNSVSTAPICLPITQELQNESLIGENVTIAGWGLTNDRIQSSVLQKASIPVLNNDLCQKAYEKSLNITNKQICAGGLEDLDSCNGDSGGPLTFPGNLGKSGQRNIQRGIISFGSLRCGVKDSPTVYTNVAHYINWILDNISN